MRTSNKINGRRIILALLLVMAVIGFVRRSVGTFAVVDGTSMYPNFKPNDVVQTRTVSEAVQRGDVVILTDNRGDRVIKRVLGLPGETVTVYRGFVYVDRQRLYEPYLLERTYTFNSDPLNERPMVWHLKADDYFVLGDNRLVSVDSRSYGPISGDQISRIVNLPENAVRPEFSGVGLSENGRSLTGKFTRSARNWLRGYHTAANAKI